MTPAQRDISRKLRIFNYAEQIGNVSTACRLCFAKTPSGLYFALSFVLNQIQHQNAPVSKSRLS
jgi:hypothetical protein